ncbi:MAG: HlyD family efflux transporter periplasmic adaptor subunit [Alphaproteobacteria bacterium]|nr:HlyD family efflux transporter periplasmic adaptor subunit [Alphaproteobacteria bacterium]
MTAQKTPPGKKKKQAPHLDISGPVLFGLAVIAIFFGAGIGGAAIIPLERGVGMPGKFIVESKVKPVQHERGGRISAVHVVEGQKVSQGDLVVSFDTASLVEQIDALKAQSQATARQLDLARQEAATMNGLYERKLTQRSRVLAIERQVAQIEKEVASIDARIAVARQELRHAEVRSPVSGRILTLKVNAIGAIAEPGGLLMEVVPDSDRLVIEAQLSPDSIENVVGGMQAKVWLPALSWREQSPLPATLSWVSPDSVEDKRTGGRYFTARLELEQAAAAELLGKVTLVPGMRAEIMLLTGKRTLLDRIVNPLLRNINRAFLN